MRYEHIQPAVFLSRPNRFIAQVELDGRTETVHVKNTGRCRELLVPGNRVYLEQAANPARKTRYDLVAVEKQRPGQPPLLVNMDAQAPNRAFEEFAAGGGFLPGVTRLQRERTYGQSRLDFYLELGERRAFAEVKGCTLEENGVCMFPDAPTERGVKHIRELMRCREDGCEAYLCIVVQMAGMRFFRPNDATDPAFGAALREASAAGVQILALECQVESNQMQISGQIPVVL
ncbi:MAG: DNA/RNA nuclease SfsA [Oscillospiraceae bacterium]|nr:DNA/RNA nuclease SfsA [Oscillospiraceae bacterium]